MAHFRPLEHKVWTAARFSCALVGLLLVGCTQPESTSLAVETPSSAVSGDGALRESIGIETLGGVFTPILIKGCELPCVVSQTFSTAEDDQDQILIHVLRG